MLADRIDTVIVGAGHAGLGVSHELQRRGVEHVVLEQGVAFADGASAAILARIDAHIARSGADAPAPEDDRPTSRIRPARCRRGRASSTFAARASRP